MSDCANIEMRELLPDLAAGTLDAHAHARVEAHLVGCADCASELETLRLVRRARFRLGLVAGQHPLVGRTGHERVVDAVDHVGER